MSLATWATKPKDLKPLDRRGLVLFAARCAIRFEAWAPPDPEGLFLGALTRVVDFAFEDPIPQDRLRAMRRPLSDLGATACNRLESTDAPLGRCRDYAVQTLVTALDVAAAVDRKTQVSEAIRAAKLSGSIPAVWAHAGRVDVRVPKGTSSVDVVAEATWSAIRADIARVAAGVTTIESADDRVRALRDLGSPWEGTQPAWAIPPTGT